MPDITGQMLKLTQIMTEINASFSQITQTEANGIARIVIITHAMSGSQLHEFKAQIASEPTINLDAAYKVLK